MFKRFLLCFLLVSFISFQVCAQLQSPAQFLGYQIGERFTPHWKIVAYYKHVAATVPGMVKLETYGHTNEGRELLVAYVSTAANISNLQTIQQANKNLTTGPAAAAASTPALVWFSYNVHGNEASSSEASMLTLYTLVNPAYAASKQWLSNTVVIMDPCLNPDGRDRYVSWYNSVAGKTPNADLSAREHREPWPGGRVNHYYFDLNRDWAWQTQVESQQRMLLYNRWLPQIHVDFHEQGINAPYYFAPAAQPFHEVITPWQRSFQNDIGRNHARYFDSAGWLYFTKEVFDLLYPSYGDTYPLYNGAIGMTYEQAGGPAGGLAALTNSGDTLTLADRALHHHTTGLSTLEVASANAGRLVREFQQFYTGARTNGVGAYKTYIIKNEAADAQRVQALVKLLHKNDIVVNKARAGNARGYNYATGREETFSISANDLLVSTQQPKGTLVNVLFEPNTAIVDSATYDITAWAMPYVYGVKAYATRQALAADAYNPPAPAALPAANAYGYVLRWNGVQSAKAVSQLVQQGVRLRFSEQPFEAGGQQFDRGSIIILKTGNGALPYLWDSVMAVTARHNVPLVPVQSGWVEKGFDFGSSRVRYLKPRQVALITGEGVSQYATGEIWHFFERELDHPVTLINAGEMANLDWNKYDVVILPDGGYRALADKPTADALKSWVNRGGNLIALEGAVAALARQDWGLKLKKGEESSDDKDGYDALRRYENRERDYIPTITPGSIFRVELDNSHPLAFGYPSYYYTLKQDDRLYDFLKEGWNVGVLKKGAQVAGFVGSKLVNRLQDGLVLGTQEMGNGTITYFADNVLLRNFWENGKLLFCNAVFFVGQ